MPLDGSQPSAIAIEGSPINQFSFSEDADDDMLRVVLRDFGRGEGMWASEFSEGDVALASVPMAKFGDGSGHLEKTDYRKLPKVDGWGFQNRFVGDWLLYAAQDNSEPTRKPIMYAVPLDGSDVKKIKLPHEVSRFDKLGSDGVAIGSARGGALGFSAIELTSDAVLKDTYILPNAGEGETRSHAFFYRPDRDAQQGESGILGLPVTRQRDVRGADFLDSSSALFFLRRNQRKFAQAGELSAHPGNARKDDCKASCVDWYGNARPIFLGNRIFALMGYELIEGKLVDGQVLEVRRIDFTPTR